MRAVHRRHAAGAQLLIDGISIGKYRTCHLHSPRSTTHTRFMAGPPAPPRR
jgi:hypothetical protein